MAQRILMCRPTFFKVAYEINPWMKQSIQPDLRLAQQQWDNLSRTLTEKCGAKIELIEPIDDLPDMVFTANAGLIREKKVYLSRFKFPGRKGEQKHFERWFAERGYTVYADDRFSFEGAAEAVFAGEKFFAAYGPRTDVGVYENILRSFGLKNVTADRKDEIANRILEQLKSTEKENLGGGGKMGQSGEIGQEKVRLITCELITQNYYHIDACFAMLTPELAIWHPKAFGEESRKRMEREIELVAVPEKEAERFACNSVVVGKKAVLPSGCEKTSHILEKRGFETHLVDISEFLKAGGACKCMSLLL